MSEQQEHSNRSWALQQWRIVGNWEPKMFLARRGDGTFCDIDKLWAEIHSDEAINRMKMLGINLSHIHFHKGYGLEHERSSIQQAKRWAEKLHENGIRVGVYIGTTSFYEVFKHPDYDRMVMKNEFTGWNKSQYFRQWWCYNSPATFEYFKEVIRVAIEELNADVLHFDWPFCFYHDHLCQCEHCLAGFSEFVREEIPQIAKAAGYEYPDQILAPPTGNQAYLATICEMQEPGDIAWTLFHANAGLHSLRRFAEYARSLRPDIAILNNGAILCGITNFSWPRPELATMKVLDMTCVEDDNENPVGVTDDGMPISRFRAYKVGSRTHTRVCCYMAVEGTNTCLKLAEAAAFNYRCLGFVETAMHLDHRLTEESEYRVLRYLVDNDKLFLDREPWHNVAVLRHHESQTLNPYPSGLTPYVVAGLPYECV